MRSWILSLVLGCCAITGYSQGTAPVEITSEEEEGEDVAVNVDSKKGDKPDGCGCGKGKPKN